MEAAASQSITDGDTIKLNGTTYRLWGIDAPELHQACKDGWPAGVVSKAALSELLTGKSVACESRGQDRYGRTIGLCRADGADVQARMVELGMAWAFTRYSSDYVGQERAAIEARAGVHAHDCEKAWDWRAQRR
ncbi:MAG TPA: thermonuclease family protein [Reyranella sp.]|nr:thermonuclease family protein [Reyranella sp.]